MAGAVAGEAASVRVVERADGTRFIYNEGAGHRSSRLADRLVTPRDASLSEIIAAHAAEQSLEPKLVQAVIQVESGYNVRALSNKGAMGLMQLMPGTARDLDVDDPWDPQENVRGGTSYLRRLLDQFGGEEELALAAYNAGPNAVVRHGGIPPYRETQDYVGRVLRLCDREPVLTLRTSASASTFSGGATARGPVVRLRRDGANRLLITNTP